jgi:DNA-binding FrmR family transcriptional regulator
MSTATLPADAASRATRGYTTTKDQLQARLRRIEGQVCGIQGMVDEDRYCIDVLTQISAVQAALDKVAIGLFDDHVKHCIKEAVADDRTDEMTIEMTAAIARLRHRN